MDIVRRGETVDWFGIILYGSAIATLNDVKIASLDIGAMIGYMAMTEIPGNERHHFDIRAESEGYLCFISFKEARQLIRRALQIVSHSPALSLAPSHTFTPINSSTHSLTQGFEINKIAATRALDTVTENAIGSKRNPFIFLKPSGYAARRQKEFTNKASPLSSFFSTFDSRDLRVLFTHLKVVDYSAGDRLVRRKTHDSSLLLIFKGKSTLFPIEASSEKTQQIHEGAVLGLKQFLDGVEWEADIIAKTSGTLLKLHKSQLDDLLSTSPASTNKILNRLVRWECFEVLKEANGRTNLASHRSAPVITEKDVFVEIQFFAPGVRSALSVEDVFSGREGSKALSSGGLLSPVFGARQDPTPAKDVDQHQLQTQNLASSQGGGEFSSQKGGKVTFKLQSMKDLTFDNRVKHHPLYLTDAYQNYLNQKDILVDKMGAQDLFNLEDETGISSAAPVGSCFVKEKLHLQAEQRKKERIRLKMEMKMQRIKGNKATTGASGGGATGTHSKAEEAKQDEVGEFDELGDPEEDFHKLESDYDGLKRELKNLQNENEALKQRLKEEKENRETLQFKIQKSAMNQELLARSQYLKEENFFNKRGSAGLGPQSTFMLSVRVESSSLDPRPVRGVGEVRKSGEVRLQVAPHHPTQQTSARRLPSPPLNIIINQSKRADSFVTSFSIPITFALMLLISCLIRLSWCSITPVSSLAGCASSAPLG